MTAPRRPGMIWLLSAGLWAGTPRPKLTVMSTRAVCHVIYRRAREIQVTTVYSTSQVLTVRVVSVALTSTRPVCNSIDDSALDQGDAYVVHARSVCRVRVCRVVAAFLMTTFKLSTVRALLEEHWKKEHSTTLKNDYHVRAAF